MAFGIMKQSVDSIQWQDYRASNKGMIVFYTSDPVSEMPIREIPEEIDSPILPEPNYENKVFGLYGCIRPKIRQAFFKSKLRYLFFLTKYAGSKEDFKDKFIITGYFRIFKTAEVQKLHLRYIKDSACIETDSCIALRADEVRFVSLLEAFMVNDEQLKSWGYNAKVNRQLRIILDSEKTSLLLEYLKSKPDQTAGYIAETKRLNPHEEPEEPEEPAEYIAIEADGSSDSVQEASAMGAQEAKEPGAPDPVESIQKIEETEVEEIKEPQPIDSQESMQKPEPAEVEQIQESQTIEAPENIQESEETKVEAIEEEPSFPIEDEKKDPPSPPETV
jgi:hypothetical protein